MLPVHCPHHDVPIASRPGADPEPCGGCHRPRNLDSVLQTMFSVPDAQAVADLEGAIAYLKRLPDANGKVGAIGFCSGGRYTLELRMYRHAGHAFFADYRPSYRAAATQDMWHRILVFYGRYLQA
jgi:dienelactone hydrolase